MSGVLAHSFMSTVADDPAKPGFIRPQADWNGTAFTSGPFKWVNGVAGQVLVRTANDSDGSGGATWTSAPTFTAMQSVQSGYSAVALQGTPVGYFAGDVPLELHSNFANSVYAYVHANAGFRAANVTFYRSRGTQAAPTAVQAGDVIFYFQGTGYSDATADYNVGGGGFIVKAQEAFTTGATGKTIISIGTAIAQSGGSSQVVFDDDTGCTGIGAGAQLDANLRVTLGPGTVGWNADNTHDLGALTGYRPKNVYVGTKVAVPTLALTPVAFASLPSPPSEGMLAWVNNSTTSTKGATISGGGSNKVLAAYNGTNWIVV